MATAQDELRTIFQTLDTDDFTEIRDAYYKAVEGLHALATALENADLKQPQAGGPLITEHLIACEAIEAMKRSELGRVL